MNGIAASLLLVVLASSGRARAMPSQPSGLDVLPSLIELSAGAGERVERPVTLTNPGGEPLLVRAETGDWSMRESGEIRFDDPGTSPSSCAAWITVEPSEVRVPAKGQTTVRLTLLPVSAFSGTRWAVVFFRFLGSAELSPGSSETVAARVGVTIYVTAPGTEREDLEFRDATAACETDGTRLRALFENRGNTAVRIRVTWQVRASDGPMTRTYAAQAVSLPGSSRESVTRPDDLPPGTYHVTALARWGARRWQSRECELHVRPRSSGTSS